MISESVAAHSNRSPANETQLISNSFSASVRFDIPTIEPFALIANVHYLSGDSRSGRPRLRPTPQLVEYIAGELRAVGSAVLGGLGFDTVGVSERKVFQWVLFREVCKKLSEDIAPGEVARYRFRHFYTKDGYLPPDAKAIESAGRRWTVKNLHFDPNAILFCHGYGPVQNITGGDLLVVRVNDYCRDVGLTSEEVLTTFGVAGQEYPAPKEEHKDRLIQEYASRIVTSVGDPIVFLNNRSSDGVAHGATPISVIEPSQPFQRSYFRTSIKESAGR